MNPQSLESKSLTQFRNALIDALPKDNILDSELTFEDMSNVLDILIKTNQALYGYQDLWKPTSTNAVMYDPDEVAFGAKHQHSVHLLTDPPQIQVTQTFSKEDLLRGHDNTGGIDIEKQTTQVTQQPEQPINRDDYIQPFPPTPQNSSYGNDLRNMNQYTIQQPQYNQPNVEVLPTPWNDGDYGVAQIHQSLSMIPPEVQNLLANAARYGNLQLVLAEMGGQYYQQQ